MNEEPARYALPGDSCPLCHRPYREHREIKQAIVGWSMEPVGETTVRLECPGRGTVNEFTVKTSDEARLKRLEAELAEARAETDAVTARFALMVEAVKGQAATAEAHAAARRAEFEVTGYPRDAEAARIHEAHAAYLRNLAANRGALPPRSDKPRPLSEIRDYARRMNEHALTCTDPDEAGLYEGIARDILRITGSPQ